MRDNVLLKPRIVKTSFNMTFTEAALLVLRLAGKPLHYKEITDVAIERSLLSHVGKSPEVTMGARLAAQVKSLDKANPLKRVKPGVFALSEWDEATIEKGLDDRTPALELVKKAELEQGHPIEEYADASSALTSQDGEGLDSETGKSVQPGSPSTPDEDEQHRAELSAGASELFASEDDDDQPIFGSVETNEEKLEGDDKLDGKRRRRRRRGRGRRDEETGVEDDGDDLPGYTVSDAEPEAVLSAVDLGAAQPRAPQQRSHQHRERGHQPRATQAVVEQQEPVQQGLTLEESSEASTLSFADALYESLSKQNASRGGVLAQTIADALRKKFKGELGLSGPALASVAAADNLARERRGFVPRFRINGPHLALTEWLFDRKFTEKSEELARCVEQVQNATLRGLTEELRRLPQRAVGELVLILLERMGVESMNLIKRPGSHGSELHLSGVLSQGGAIRLPIAIVVRRDARDIGREKVTELRGALHHYGSPSGGWLLTTGQVLSGAREEAQASVATPVTLTGRTELAELLLAHGVGVRAQRIEVPVLDVALFEGLSGR